MIIPHLTKKMSLMHKDIKVLSGDYDTYTHGFRRIRAIHEPTHIPVGVSNGMEDSDVKSLNYWLFWRGIPDYRVDVERLKRRFEVDDAKDLLEMEYALSVSDNYWLKPENEDLRYRRLNFYDRPFDHEGFAKAMFRSDHYDPPATAAHTPNNTLCGYHRKAWMRRPDGLELYKGSTGFHQQECINEWIASEMAQRLGMHAVKYEVKTYEHQLVSTCYNFLDKNTDLVTAENVIKMRNPGKKEFWIDIFLDILESNGIPDASERLDEQIILDYLMMNTDRHLQNHGILTDAETCRWIGMAPIFDTGTGLGCFVKTPELKDYEQHRTCKFLNARHFSHEDLLTLCVSLNRYDFSALNDIPQMFLDKMVRFQDQTGIPNERIEALAQLLQRRIIRIQRHQAGLSADNL